MAHLGGSVSDYTAILHDAWEIASRALVASGQEWTEACVISDLRWWADALTFHGERLPTQRQLAARWSWPRSRVSKMVHDVERWSDPKKGKGRRKSGLEQARDLSETLASRAPKRAPRATPQPDSARVEPGAARMEPGQQVIPGTCDDDSATNSQTQPDSARLEPNARVSSHRSPDTDTEEGDFVARLCSLYTKHSERLTPTGRRSTLEDTPDLRRRWADALEVAVECGYGEAELLGVFELAFATKRGAYWQRGGEGNKRKNGRALVTYLLRCRGRTHGTGVPSRDTLVDRLHEAAEFIKDKAHFEEKMRENQRRRELRLVGGEG